MKLTGLLISCFVLGCVCGRRCGSPKPQQYGKVDCSIPTNQVTLHPHPTSCTQYLQCVHGRTKERPCAPGTEFSPSIGVCVHPWESDCTSEQQESEEPSQEVDDQRAPVTQEEPLPEEPVSDEPTTREAPEEPIADTEPPSDPQEISTVETELTTITEEIATTISIPEGSPKPPQYCPPSPSALSTTTNGKVDCSIPTNQVTLHPHPTSCTQYLQCFARPCAPGTEFSPSMGVCVHSWQSDCTSEQEESEEPSQEVDDQPAPVAPEKLAPEKPAPEDPELKESESEELAPEAPASKEPAAQEDPLPEEPISDEPTTREAPEEPIADTEPPRDPQEMSTVETELTTITEEIATTISIPEDVAEPILNRDSICSKAPAGIFLYADPINCSNYVYCVFGMAIVLSCYGGRFDAVSGRCVPGECSD